MKHAKDIPEKTKLTDSPQSIEQQAGYPDISKANTKIIVIISLICILIIFFLSVLVPIPAQNDTSSGQTDTTPPSTEATTESSESEKEPVLFDIG